MTNSELLSNGEHEEFDMLNPTPNNTELMSIFDSMNQEYGKMYRRSGVDELQSITNYS